jgi:lipoate-protein ligase A
MSKNLTQIKEEIENISRNINSLSINQVINLLKDSIKELNEIKLEEDAE